MLRNIILVSAGLAVTLIALVVFAIATPGAAAPNAPAGALGASISAAAPASAPVVQAVPSIDAYHGPGGGYAGRVELVSPVVIEQRAGEWVQFSTPFARGVWAPSAALDAVLGQEPQGGALEALPELGSAPASVSAPAPPVQAAAAPAPAPVAAPAPPVISPLEPLAELAAAPAEAPPSQAAPVPAGSTPGWYAAPANGCDSASPSIVCAPPSHGSAPKPDTKP